MKMEEEEKLMKKEDEPLQSRLGQKSDGMMSVKPQTMMRMMKMIGKRNSKRQRRMTEKNDGKMLIQVLQRKEMDCNRSDDAEQKKKQKTKRKLRNGSSLEEEKDQAGWKIENDETEVVMERGNYGWRRSAERVEGDRRRS